MTTEMPRRGQRKFAMGARVRGKEEGPGSFRGRTGTVIGYVSGSGYEVSFDDGQDEGRVEYAYAHWLESAPYSPPAMKSFPSNV